MKKAPWLMKMAALVAWGCAAGAGAAEGSHERVQATVQKVYAAKDGAFEHRAYGITWQGQEVVVVDRLLQGKHHTDDTITVLVIKNPYPNGKEPHGLLHFLLVPQTGKKGGAAGGGTPATPPEEPGRQGGYFEPIVRKVFSAQDGANIFRAYVVEWKGEEVIVSDPLANSHYQVGDKFKAMIFQYGFPIGGETRGLMHFQAVSPGIAARMGKRRE